VLAMQEMSELISEASKFARLLFSSSLQRQLV
jgi:hypothetical protein